MNLPTPVIKITNLHKAYGDLQVLKGVDVTAHRGDVISLIGSSGSGKSTLLRCCNLLEDSQEGEISFKGEPVKWTSGTSRRPQIKNKSRGFAQICRWCSNNLICGHI